MMPADADRPGGHPVPPSQYRTAANLDARIALHERFSANPEPWPRWVFDRLRLPARSRILELGCGPGTLWRENAGRVPARWSVTLTDRSPGMVREAASSLGHGRLRFAFAVADAQALPFPARSFDAVIANHMLYHVPDRALALAEIVRVLAPGGRLFAATNGRRHLRELRRWGDLLAPGSFDDDTARFGLENGAELLAPWFSWVELVGRKDALVVTEVEPVVAYLLSGAGVQTGLARLDVGEAGRRLATVRAELERELAAHGAIRITKDTGLFVASTDETGRR